MARSSNNVNMLERVSEEYHKDEDLGIGLDLWLEKRILVPRKKLLVLSLNGLLIDRVYCGNFKETPKNRCPNDFVLEDPRTKLLLVWDQDECTDSGFKSLEHNNKRLLFKELKIIWKEIKTGGRYSKENTLLIDDKPYKALLNPPNTTIFPMSYNAEDEDDEVLGDLGLYLKGLAKARDVQSYMKEHSFGQPAITSFHPDWTYYSEMLRLTSLRKN